DCLLERVWPGIRRDSRTAQFSFLDRYARCRVGSDCQEADPNNCVLHDKATSRGLGEGTLHEDQERFIYSQDFCRDSAVVVVLYCRRYDRTLTYRSRG